MKYMILTSRTSSNLERIVNRCLMEGWKLQGGITIAKTFAHGQHYEDYLQAMVKGETPMDESR